MRDTDVKIDPIFTTNVVSMCDDVRVSETGDFYIDVPEDVRSLSKEALAYMVQQHGIACADYDRYMKYFRGEHTRIINQPRKSNNKPDNRIVQNYPRQLVNAYTGYFAGVNPTFAINREEGDDVDGKVNELGDDIKKDGAEELERFVDNNNINHFFVQQAKYVDIFGRSLGFVYQDENADTRLTTLDPRQGFIVYSDDVAARPVYAVRYRKFKKSDSKIFVDVHAVENEGGENCVNYTAENVDALDYASEGSEKTLFDSFETDKITYGRLPMIEFASNDEKMGIFTDLITVFDAIDSALSEKKNDVDYFGDAILTAVNAQLNKRDFDQLRDKRILAINGSSEKNAEIKFLEKPTADETQENLINRLVSSMYDISGIVNLNDRNFTNASSGQALKQRLQAMRQNADTKASFFVRSFREVFRCLFTGLLNPEALDNVIIRLKKNEPLDVLDESQSLVNLAAANGAGLISVETALTNMSYIENPQEEMARIAKERAEGINSLGDLSVPKPKGRSDDEE